MIYNKQYFIRKFSKIPTNQWCVGTWSTFSSIVAKTQYCALGHCGQRMNHDIHNPAPNEAQALVKLFGDDRRLVPNINDGKDVRYNQRTPKQRILAALKDLP